MSGGSRIVAQMRDAVEFDLVRAFTARLGASAAGIGDDAASIALPIGAACVVSVDAAVEEVHFRREWFSPREIGYRAAASAMSDLAAMGATPRAMLIALVLPDRWRSVLGELADGVRELAELARCPVVGGNMSAGTVLSITTTVIGSGEGATLPRSALRVGDSLYVTGRLGGPGVALAALLAGRHPDAALRDRLARPSPRIAEAQWLATRGARSGIDVSDGLRADAEHLAAASRVHLLLQAQAVPLMPGVTTDDALTSGEEYELLVGASAPIDEAEFTRRFGIPLTVVGRVVDGAPGVTVVGAGRVDKAPGHDHFSG